VNVARRLSTTRLLVLLAGLLALAVAGTAAASAALGGASKPPAKPLLNAVLDSVAGDRPVGVTADIRFTNNVVPAGSLATGGSPLVTGATGRVWVALDGRLRAELKSDAGDVTIVSDGRTLSAYDASSKTVYRTSLPSGRKTSDEPADGDEAGAGPMGGDGVTGALGELLGGLGSQATLSDAVPTTVAGRPAYAVRVSPKHDGGLLGAVELAFDAERPVPLRVGLYAADEAEPVLELTATKIEYAPIPESVTTLDVPAGTRVVELPAGLTGLDHEPGDVDKPAVRAEGEAAVRAALPFPLAAPAELVGLPRKSVRLIDVDGSPAALVIYGEGLGGAVVIETVAGKAPKEEAVEDALPKLSIDGAEGVELSTALGTMVRVSEDGVSYTLVGSLPAGAAETAARELLEAARTR
jgi:outer membrane lipoprotein-sorting protein